jgi:hypothetical protein
MYRKLGAQHEVAGYLVAVVGVMYGVLVASVVIIVWAQFDAARRAVDREAGDVATLFRLAAGLPGPYDEQLIGAVREYTRVVPAMDWPAMARAAHSPEGDVAMARLWAAVLAVSPSAAVSAELQDKALDVLEEVTALRRQRLSASHVGLSGLIWLVLVAGGVITVSFTFLFGVESERLHQVMVALVAAMIGLNLFLIAALDRPFTGDLQVSPEPFALVEEALEIPVHGP